MAGGRFLEKPLAGGDFPPNRSLTHPPAEALGAPGRRIGHRASGLNVPTRVRVAELSSRLLATFTASVSGRMMRPRCHERSHATWHSQLAHERTGQTREPMKMEPLTVRI